MSPASSAACQLPQSTASPLAAPPPRWTGDPGPERSRSSAKQTDPRLTPPELHRAAPTVTTGQGPGCRARAGLGDSWWPQDAGYTPAHTCNTHTTHMNQTPLHSIPATHNDTHTHASTSACTHLPTHTCTHNTGTKSTQKYTNAHHNPGICAVAEDTHRPRSHTQVHKHAEHTPHTCAHRRLQTLPHTDPRGLRPLPLLEKSLSPV